MIAVLEVCVRARFTTVNLDEINNSLIPDKRPLEGFISQTNQLNINESIIKTHIILQNTKLSRVCPKIAER